MWVQRKEVYTGYIDGTINVYTFNPAMTLLHMSASFHMHQGAIQSIHILNDLKFAISSGFDSTLNLWEPPEKWERKMVVTTSMNKAFNPKDDLTTIREDLDNECNETVVKRKISALSDDKLFNDLDQFQALLSQD